MSGITKKPIKWYDNWVQNLSSLEDKVVLITGTTSGTGYYTAIAAIQKNAKAVFLLNRESQRSRDAYEKLMQEIEQVKSNTKLHSIACDLMNFDAVKQAANEVNEICNEYEQGLNIVINNAGIMAFPDDRTKDGFDVQMQVNHLSHFLLTKMLMPSIMKNIDAKEVRVVQHSSGARNISGTNLNKKYFVTSKEHTLGGNGMIAAFQRYHQTKLSNSVFMMKLKKEFEAKGLNIKSVCAEPGVATTDLGDNLASSHKNPGIVTRFQAWLFSIFVKYIIPTQSAADGALPLIQASFGDNVSSGDFYMPDHGSVGEPMKLINAGKEEPKIKSAEKLTFSSANQDNVFTWSEEALGIKFFE